MQKKRVTKETNETHRLKVIVKIPEISLEIKVCFIVQRLEF